MNGGVLPFGLGTQGTGVPSGAGQQFALVAQASPIATQVVPVHLGTPTLSVLQLSTCMQLPLQQSQDALHDWVDSRQMSPSGLQPDGLRHTPTTKGGVMSQVTGVPEPPGRPADPQQSPSCVQRSPTT